MLPAQNENLSSDSQHPHQSPVQWCTSVTPALEVRADASLGALWQASLAPGSVRVPAAK